MSQNPNKERLLQEFERQAKDLLDKFLIWLAGKRSELFTAVTEALPSGKGLTVQFVAKLEKEKVFQNRGPDRQDGPVEAAEKARFWRALEFDLPGQVDDFICAFLYAELEYDSGFPAPRSDDINEWLLIAYCDYTENAESTLVQGG